MAFRALPRPQFASLQAAIFPIYFSLQTALPVAVALTASKGGSVLGLSGLASPENRLNTLLPMATVALTGLINQVVLRPLTIKIMQERKHQGEYPDLLWKRIMRIGTLYLMQFHGLTIDVETRDGKKSYDPAPHSKEMVALNKRFARVHGFSSLVNLVSLIATVYYGAVLSKKLE